jgi:tRNA(His) 5'-end guanylyltransferase
MDKTSLGDRMKAYETVSKSKLLRRTPVIIRLDGKAFHTWTRHLRDVDESLDICPYSSKMHGLMRSTTQYLMDNIQNAVLGYSQSDEISILLNDWKKLNTDQWFDGTIQKIASVSASAATAAFNDKVRENDDRNFLPLALFDARVFNVPKEEVVNYFVWRQQDATRNSIQMLGQFYFSHKQMHGKNVSNIQDMLMESHQENWNDIDTWKKRGFCVTPDGYDKEIPIFTKDRNYVEQFLESEE